jgi:Mrp family chromosome partitioning ATPase
MTLSTYADAILVVARPELLRRRTLDDLHRVLASTPTPVLGYVVTGGEGDATYGYGYGEGHAYSYGSRERQKEKGKV